MPSLLSEEIRSDERLWNEISREALLAFFAVLPHIKMGFTVRDAQQLRIEAVPLATEITAKKMEAYIQEWIKAKICRENSDKHIARLFWVDHEKVNWSLSSYAMRRSRASKCD